MGLFLVALLAVLPIAAARRPPPEPGALSWAAAFAIDALVALLLAALAIALGLGFGRRTDLGMLLSHGHATADGADGWARRTLPLTAALGIGFGVLTALSLQALMSLSLLPQDLFSEVQRTPWMGILASVSAGIKEEILLRFGLMTLLAWLVMKITRRERVGPGAIWMANIVAALLFGAAHMPAASSMTVLTPAVVAVALVFNGVAGVTFGWLYWRRGILAAIVAHIVADIVLQVLYPLMVGAAGP
jgi:membrane protease YdiL (CAAX protease family)